MSLLLTDVTAFLVSEGLIEGATEWVKKSGHMPSSPDKVIVVYETGGFPPESAPDSSDETEYDEPTFQVRGRGVAFGYEELRTKMGAIYRALHGSELAPASGDPVYVYVYAIQSGPFPLGLDKVDDRPEMTWNFKALRERET